MNEAHKISGEELAAGVRSVRDADPFRDFEEDILTPDVSHAVMRMHMSSANEVHKLTAALLMGVSIGCAVERRRSEVAELNRMRGGK